MYFSHYNRRSQKARSSTSPYLSIRSRPDLLPKAVTRTRRTRSPNPAPSLHPPLSTNHPRNPKSTQNSQRRSQHPSSQRKPFTASTFPHNNNNNNNNSSSSPQLSTKCSHSHTIPK